MEHFEILKHKENVFVVATMERVFTCTSNAEEISSSDHATFYELKEKLGNGQEIAANSTQEAIQIYEFNNSENRKTA